jgi:hypothetical protein
MSSFVLAPANFTGDSFKLTSESPRWELLTSEEKGIAERAVSECPLTFLVMAIELIQRLVQAVRRATNDVELTERVGLLNRFLDRAFDGRDENAFREGYFPLACTRLILLGADRIQAVRLAEEAVQVLTHRRSCPLHPSPRSLRYSPLDRAKREDVEKRWDADGRWLIEARRTEFAMNQYVSHEVQAYPGGQVPYLFGSPSEWMPEYPHPRNNEPAPAPPAELTSEVIDTATNHVLKVLGWAWHIVTRANSEDEVHERWQGEHVRDCWERLSRDLSLSGCVLHLLEFLYGHNDKNYEVCGIIRASAHDAILELSRRICLAFRGAVSLSAPEDSNEPDRWGFGPWEAHEVKRAFPFFLQRSGDLISALDPVGYQTLEADVKRESSRLKVAHKLTRISVASGTGGRQSETPGSAHPPVYPNGVPHDSAVTTPPSVDALLAPNSPGTAADNPNKATPPKGDDVLGTTDTNTGGRPKLGEGPNATEKDKARRNLYEIIRAENREGLGATALKELYRNNKDVRKLIEQADAEWDVPIFRAALSWIKDNPS